MSCSVGPELIFHKLVNRLTSSRVTTDSIQIRYPDSHRHILKGLLSLIPLSQKVKTLFDYQTLGVNGFPSKLKQIRRN